ncbi:hypothetical protein EVG20_g6968, partial [Dentipellis fragilis]
MPRGNGIFNEPRGRGGRGRGGRGRGFKQGRGRGRGRGLGYIPYDDLDFLVDVPPNQYNSRGVDSPRGRGGRGRGTPFNRSNYNSGASTPTRGGAPLRGRGGGPGSENLGPKDRERQKILAKKLRSSTAPLSQLLYEDRPLLRPVIFVRSQATPTLFTEEEEIFKPVVEEAGTEDKSHVPTADRVFEVFHHVDGGNPPEEDPLTSQLPSDIEGLEEIDFADMGRVREEVDAHAASTEYITAIQEKQSQGDADVTIVEEKFTGFYIDKKPAAVTESTVAEDEVIVDRVGEDALLGEQHPMDEDDEVIVYVAPHPRNGRATPAPAPPTSAPLASTSYTPLPDIEMTLRSPSPSAVPAPTFTDIQFSTLGSTPPRAVRRQYAGQPRSLRKRMHQGRIERQREQRHAMFGSFGAIMSEAHLRDEAPERDPREEEAEKGGDEGGGEDDGGMVEDEELGIDAMKAFVQGMGPTGSRHVTMDDIEVEERVRKEDEDDEDEVQGSDSEGSDSSEDEDGEAEEIFFHEEKMLVAEAGGSAEEDEVSGEEDEEDEVSSDEDQSPKSSFEARLKRIRQRTAGKTTQQMLDEQLTEEDEVGNFRLAQKWEDDDDGGDNGLVANVQAMLDENSDILHGRDRKARKKIFKAIRDGDFDDDEFDFAAMKPARRKKDAYIPPDLR